MTKGKNKETVTMNQSQTDQSSDLESIISQLATNMLQLQETVGVLAAKVQSKSDDNKTECVDNKNYILHWRELGGPNITFNPSNTGNIHPMVFLKKLLNTFNDAGVPEQNRVSFALSCLRGHASEWAQIKEGSFTDFGVFETAFQNRFWGVEKQRELYLHLHYGKHDRGSMSDYFVKHFKESGFLTEKIEEGKLIEMLAKHFSLEVQRGIITQGLALFDQVEEYLRKLDETFSENASRQSNNNRYVPPQNRYNNENTEPRNTRARTPLTNNNNHGNNNSNREQHRSNNIEVITKFNADSDELLSATEDECLDEMPIPYVQVVIKSQLTDALIDSGSEITAISEAFYLKNKGVLEDCPVLPVANTLISVAVGARKQRIKQQIYLPCQIGDVQLDITCLVIPNLNQDVILGCDWLKTSKANLDFCERQMKFVWKNKTGLVNLKYRNDVVDHLCVNSIDIQENVKVDENNTKRHSYSENDFRSIVSKSDLQGEKDKTRLLDLLLKYKDIFSECPGLIENYEHSIVLKDDSPFSSKSYPIPVAYKSEVDKQIREMLVWGIIEPAITEFISPLIVVKKKDSSVRICLDCRYVNSRMHKDLIIPPNPNELLTTFKNKQVLSTIDLTSSYWQVKIRKKDRKYTGFLYNGITYQFTVLQFGISEPSNVATLFDYPTERSIVRDKNFKEEWV